MLKKDIFASLIIGEISAWLILAISQNLAPVNISWLFWLLPIVFPLLCLAGMVAATIIGKKIAVLYQFAKFFLVGGMNTLVDLGILNLLIFASGTSQGIIYSAFKGVSFLIATTNSYFWNKLWAFNAKQGNFGKFLLVSAISLFINVGIASLMVNSIGPQFGINDKTWATVGALIGSMASLFSNFIGYKMLVFKI